MHAARAASQDVKHARMEMNMQIAKPLTLAVGLLAFGAAPVMAGTGTSEFWVRTFAGGNIRNGSGISSNTRTALGNYVATFPRAVDTCTYLVNLNGAPAGTVTIAAGATPDQIVIKTFTTAGGAIDHAYNLLVRCQD